MKKFPIDYLQPYEKSPKNLNVVVETPKGSQVKYSYDEKRGMFIISKVLPEGMVFPFNFGFVPGTLAADGDPLDILILNEQPVAANTLLSVRPLAVIKATQVEKRGAKPVRNDRIIGQATGKESPLEERKLILDKVMVNELSLFFKTYNSLYGKKFEVLGVEGAEKAKKLVVAAIEKYRGQDGKKRSFNNADGYAKNL